MKELDLKNYIGRLLDTTEVDEKVFTEISNAKLLLTVYRLGLEGKPLHSDFFMMELDLEKDIPAPYHTAVAQIAILKSKKTQSDRAIDYLLKNVEKLLEDFRNYFLSPNKKNK